MHNRQAIGLKKMMLSGVRPKVYFLAFEPFEIKKSELKELSKGKLIELGASLPNLYIYKNNIVIGQVKLGLDKSRESIIVLAKERIANFGKSKSRNSILDARISIFRKSDFVVGKLIRLPEGSFDNIILFVKNKPIWLAKLVYKEGNYYLLCDEIL